MDTSCSSACTFWWARGHLERSVPSWLWGTRGCWSWNMGMPPGNAFREKCRSKWERIMTTWNFKQTQSVGGSMGGSRAYGSPHRLQNHKNPTQEDPAGRTPWYNKAHVIIKVLTDSSITFLSRLYIPLLLSTQARVCTWLAMPACSGLQPFLFPQ